MYPTFIFSIILAGLLLYIHFWTGHLVTTIVWIFYSFAGYGRVILRKISMTYKLAGYLFDLLVPISTVCKGQKCREVDNFQSIFCTGMSNYIAIISIFSDKYEFINSSKFMVEKYTHKLFLSIWNSYKLIIYMIGVLCPAKWVLALKCKLFCLEWKLNVKFFCHQNHY